MNKECLEKIGHVLKEKRESNGITIEQVSNILKINPAYIEAIEKGEIEKFPAEVFLKGFLKNYSRYLKVDLSEFLIQDNQQKREEQRISPVTEKRVKNRINLGYIFLASVFLFIFLSWARIEYVNRKIKSDYEKRQNTSFKTMTTAKELALQEQKKNLMLKKEVNDRKIIIRTKDDCWIEVKDGDKKIFQGLLFSGEQRELDFKKGLKLKAGNAAAIEVEVNGKKLENLGQKGEVREIIIE